MSLYIFEQKLISELIIDREYFFESEIYEDMPFWLDANDPEMIIPIHAIKTIASEFKAVKLSTKDDLTLLKYWVIRAKFARNLNRYSECLTLLKKALAFFFRK